MERLLLFLISVFISACINSNSHPKVQIAPSGSRLTIESEKPTILHFWATWCTTCIAELPNIELLRQYAEKSGVGFKSILIDDTRYEASRYIFEYKAPLHTDHFIDENNQVKKQYKVLGVPTTIVVDGKGQIIEVYDSEIKGKTDRIVGLRLWDGDTKKRLIEDALLGNNR